MRHLIYYFALAFYTIASFAQCRTTPLTPSQEMRSSGSTLIGTVESAQAVPDSSFHLDGTNYTVRVDRILHGRMVRQNTVTIFSENSGEQFPMTVGSQYLLFVHLNYNTYEVDKCGHSGLLQASTFPAARPVLQYAKLN